MVGSILVRWNSQCKHPDRSIPDVLEEWERLQWLKQTKIGVVGEEGREVMGYKIMQGLGRLVYKEFGVILNEMKSGILLRMVTEK